MNRSEVLTDSLPRIVPCILLSFSHPVQYMEKSANSFIFRSQRAEVRAAHLYEKDRQRHLETLCSNIQAELEKSTAAHGEYNDM